MVVSWGNLCAIASAHQDFPIMCNAIFTRRLHPHPVIQPRFCIRLLMLVSRKLDSDRVQIGFKSPLITLIEINRNQSKSIFRRNNMDPLYLGIVALFAALTFGLIACCRRLESKK
jgi:hypothetical protein